jgi:hypothetical protein
MNKSVTTKLLNAVEIWNFVTLNVQWCFSFLLKANLSLNVFAQGLEEILS